MNATAQKVVSIKHRPKNYRKPYTDEQLIEVLLDAPTDFNCHKYAAKFERSAEAIAQIYQWAAVAESYIKKTGRRDEKFIAQIRRLKRRLHWVI